MTGDPFVEPNQSGELKALNQSGAESPVAASSAQTASSLSPAQSSSNSSNNRGTKTILLKKSGLGDSRAGGWIRAFTRLHKVPVFRRVWIYLFVMALYTFVVDHFLDKDLMANLAKQSGTVAFSSIVLGVLLVFRTETAYKSWEEGGIQWSLLLNVSRTFCYKLKAISSISEMERMKMGRLIISFAYGLKHHLRGTIPSEPLAGLENPERIQNLPMHVIDRIFNLMHRWQKEKLFSEETLTQLLDTHMQAMVDICGACERIKNSEMSVSYRAFMRQGIVLNLIVCPWLLATDFSLLLSLPIILIGTYFLVGLELIAEAIEEPFGKDLDDLPLDTICGYIRETVTEILGLNKQLKYTQASESPIPDLLKT